MIKLNPWKSLFKCMILCTKEIFWLEPTGRRFIPYEQILGLG